jgi:hypothetical protein
MKASEFIKNNNISSTIVLKDGRILYTTENGFRYWVVDKNGKNVDEITEQQYLLSKKHRETKRNKSK